MGGAGWSISFWANENLAFKIILFYKQQQFIIIQLTKFIQSKQIKTSPNNPIILIISKDHLNQYYSIHPSIINKLTTAVFMNLRDVLSYPIYQIISTLLYSILFTKKSFIKKIKLQQQQSQKQMPWQLPLSIAKWLKQLALIDTIVLLTSDKVQIPYNNQIYLQNGYIIGMLLKIIFKVKGFIPQGLLKIRKIAHITSNQNWFIIQEIMKQLKYNQDVNIHQITPETVCNILDFLYQLFANKKKSKINQKSKNTFLDPQSYGKINSLEECNNLLQFFIFVITKTITLSLSQSLGLLIDDAKYLKQIIIYGTNHLKYQPIHKMYQFLIQNTSRLNHLLTQQKQNISFIMKCLIFSIFSQNQEICSLGCFLLDNLDIPEWFENQGYILLLRSSTDKSLDLLMKKLTPKFQIIFNEALSDKFINKYMQLQTYSKLIKYLLKSLYNKQLFILLPLSYYHHKAVSIFQPDVIANYSSRQKMAAKKLIMNICLFFWNKLTHTQKNRVLYTLDNSLCVSQTERLITLSFIFQILLSLSSKQHSQYLKKMYHIIQKYHKECGQDIKKFIMDNFSYLLHKQEDLFSYNLFLQGYSISSIAQNHDYQIINTISKDKFLKKQWIENILKIGTIYYYQQLHASCFIIPIQNIITNYSPIEWGLQISQQILLKWPNLTIPSYQVLPPNTKNIKFRSVSFKKKEMILFTELNRYKKILTLLSKIKDKSFLLTYSKNITSTIHKVEKSKYKEMQNTKIFLNSLLGNVDIRQLQIKHEKLSESLISYSNPTIKVSNSSNNRHQDHFLDQYQRDQSQRMKQTINEDEGDDDDVDNNKIIDSAANINKTEMNDLIDNSDNQFMNPDELQIEINPLLPFTDDQLNNHSPKLYTQGDLFQNYQQIYIKNLNIKYRQLLNYSINQYQRSINVQHFLKLLHINNYFQRQKLNQKQKINQNDQLLNLKIIQQKLKHLYDDNRQIGQRLIIEIGLMMFQFKKNRRIMITCLESFYQLLIDKNSLQFNQEQNKNHQTQPSNNIQFLSKLDFSYKINQKIMSNIPLQPYFLCLELINDLFKESIGIHLLEPISKLISQIKQTNPTNSKKNDKKQSIRNNSHIEVQDKQERQLVQLQNMIDQESLNLSKVNQSKINNRLKNGGHFKQVKKQSDAMIREKRQQAYEKWADVQKRVVMRRKQLQEKSRLQAKK